MVYKFQPCEACTKAEGCESLKTLKQLVEQHKTMFEKIRVDKTGADTVKLNVRCEDYQ